MSTDTARHLLLLPYFLVCIALPPRLYAVEPGLLDYLDRDRNGLYDDLERSALLGVLQSACPNLRADYDADGDGKVTIQEQTAGRDPLSQRIPDTMVEELPPIPWAIDIFPEWIMTAYLQEDVTPGPVAQCDVRGTIKATGTQNTQTLQPVKEGPVGGIQFAPRGSPGCLGRRWRIALER